MSLRLNIYGWSLAAFKKEIGSKNSAVLEKATALIAETLTKEPNQSWAKAWLRTLIMDGFPFQQDRAPSAAPADGGLLTVQMETEAHVFATYCLARAIALPEHLDLATDSSNWKHPSVAALNDELRACGFTKTKTCGLQYFSWISALGNGTPLFGDDFRTDWSFYSIFDNSDLALMVPVFRAAADFRRTLPEGYPAEHASQIAMSLSDDGKAFALDLVRWFEQIHQAGQDAFILWW
jgi:hypothetical protein